MLRFRCLRQPPIYHIGETIQAGLSFRSNGQHGFMAMPEFRRHFFSQIVMAEPTEGTIDPLTLDPRIRVGGSGGWSEAESWDREIDVNEWIQFQRPGRYMVHVVLKRGVLLPVEGEKGARAFRYCDLKSNAESVEVLSPDTGWEAAELARTNKLFESPSEGTRFRGASALRYLNTPAAAVALVGWCLRIPDEPVNSELTKGIFESRYSEIVQTELEKALRSNASFPASAVGILAFLEVRRQFINRPRPSDPKAAQAWFREYWDLFNSVKSKYSTAAGHSLR
jgi:hypothetical protein